jgi:hypothetical protein
VNDATQQKEKEIKRYSPRSLRHAFADEQVKITVPLPRQHTRVRSTMISLSHSARCFHGTDVQVKATTTRWTPTKPPGFLCGGARNLILYLGCEGSKVSTRTHTTLNKDKHHVVIFSPSSKHHVVIFSPSSMSWSRVLYYYYLLPAKKTTITSITFYLSSVSINMN